MSALSKLQENDGTLADDLVDDEGADNHEEDGAEGKDEMELSPKNVIVCMLDEEHGNLVQVLVLHAFVRHELVLRDTKTMQKRVSLNSPNIN